MLTVIGAGFPRTGTSSLKAALEKLGFGPCSHMFELMQHSDQVDVWRRLTAGEPVGWDEVFAGYRSALDWPASYFWRDLAAAYPEAKVILTVRDPHRWYASITNTFMRGLQQQTGSADAPQPPEPIAQLLPLLHRIREDSLGPGAPDEEQAVAAFQRHTAEVQHSLPADRLLTFQVNQGWEPLCDFLGVDPPVGEPFPHLNDTDTMRRMFDHSRNHGRLVTPFDPTG